MTTDDEQATRALAELVPDELHPDLDHDARLERLVRVRRRVGDGSIDDPHRTVTTYHTLEGAQLWTDDVADDPRVEMLQDALREALSGIRCLLDSYPNDDKVAAIRERAAKLAKMTHDDWRPA